MIKTILHIIPYQFRKQLPKFSALSMVNLVLELLSIAYLIPVFLLLLDYESSKAWLSKFVDLDSSNISILIFGFIISFVVKSVIQIKIYKYQTNYVFNTATRLSCDFLDHILTKDYLEFQKKNTAKTIQNVNMIGADFANNILLSLNTFFTEGTLVLVVLLISMWFYFKLTALVLGILSVIFVVLIFVRRQKVLKINSKLSKTYSKITSNLLNIIQGYLELKSLGKDREYQRKFNDSISEFNNNYSSLNIYRQTNIKYLEMLLIASLTIVLFYISNRQDNQSNVFLLSFIAGSAIKLLPSVNKIIVAYTNYTAFKYTIDILKDLDSGQKNQVRSIDNFENSIELKQVTFQYNESHKLLDNISLKINNGHFIGITGESGQGKTTLLSLIMNLLQPNSGEICVDEQKLDSTHNVFGIINYIPQNPFIFEGTMLYNIVLDFNTDIDYNKIHRLAKILKLEDLMKTRQSLELDINSLELSGGQKQRLALLRLLYHDSDILVLDEATNQLDDNTETQILQYLKELSVLGKTILFVSHNPKLQDYCDEYFSIESSKLLKNI